MATSVTRQVRNFAKRDAAVPVPDLTLVQQDAYERFLQLTKPHDKRDPRIGLEALMREIFPIESYDASMRLRYLHYKLDPPRYRPDECRELRLTYGMPSASASGSSATATRRSARRRSTSARSRS